MKTKIAAAVGFAVFCAGVAVAATHVGGHEGHMGKMMKLEGPKTRAEMEAKVKEHFAQLDQNKDGFVTAEERTAAHAAKMAENNGAHFATMDTNKDGSISRAEFDAAHSSGAAMHGGQRGGKRVMIMRHGPGGASAPMMEDSDGGDDVEVNEHVTKGKDGKEIRRVMVMRRDGGMMMARADTNNDGKVSLDEALTGARARFDRIDANKDGTISDAERAAQREVRKERRMKWKERRG